MIKLAIVLPCYNEEEILRHTTSRLTEFFHRMMTGQIISEDSRMVFVNDGSQDNTWQIIKELYQESQYICGINLSRNVGHQNAIMAGMMSARQWADAVITMDADLQDDMECIPKMISYFEQGNDIVYGVKVLRQSDPFLKRVTAKAFYKIQKVMGIKCFYNHADFRLMSKRSLDILATYTERNLYLRGLIPHIGLPSITVKDVINERMAGQSKYTFPKMCGLALNGIIAFSEKPLYVIMYIGVLFIVIAFGIAVYVIYSLTMGLAVQGWASLLLSVWLVGGFILISLGIIGVYISKIYTEVKHRPLYHINETLSHPSAKL